MIMRFSDHEPGGFCSVESNYGHPLNSSHGTNLSPLRSKRNRREKGLVFLHNINQQAASIGGGVSLWYKK